MKPQVKESEKSRVLSTKDYSMFEFPDTGISKKHLSFVKDSILDKNLLPDFPVLVDDQYNILDGKYKFLACYELKLPVHYKVAEVARLEDAVRIKEISKKTPLNQLIEIHKEKEPYRNLLYLKSLFKDRFRYREILSCVDGMSKNQPGASQINVARYPVASGKVPQFDVAEVERRLTTVIYIIEEFKWPLIDAIAVLYAYKFHIDFAQESKTLRQIHQHATAIDRAGYTSHYMWEWSIRRTMSEEEYEERILEDTIIYKQV